MVLIPLSLCLASLLSQATPLERFHAAGRDDHYAKMRIIADVVLGRSPASPAQVEELLVAAMKDPDPGVSREAVGSMRAAPCSMRAIRRRCRCSCGS